MLNKIALMGRLTREPELKHTQGGVAVCTITLACERDFTGQDGRREADFIDVVCWRGTAELAARWFRKGLLVAVTGRLQSRKWSDQYGQNRTNWEVVAESVYFAERAGDGNPPAPAAAASPGIANQGAAARGGHRGPREDLRPVDASRADVEADYTGDLYRLPQDDFAGLDEDEDIPF